MKTGRTGRDPADVGVAVFGREFVFEFTLLRTNPTVGNRNKRPDQVPVITFFN